MKKIPMRRIPSGFDLGFDAVENLFSNITNLNKNFKSTDRILENVNSTINKIGENTGEIFSKKSLEKFRDISNYKENFQTKITEVSNNVNEKLSNLSSVGSGIANNMMNNIQNAMNSSKASILENSKAFISDAAANFSMPDINKILPNLSFTNMQMPNANSAVSIPESVQNAGFSGENSDKVESVRNFKITSEITLTAPQGWQMQSDKGEISQDNTLTIHRTV